MAGAVAGLVPVANDPNGDYVKALNPLTALC
jgi:hypothetical protein